MSFDDDLDIDDFQARNRPHPPIEAYRDIMDSQPLGDRPKDEAWKPVHITPFKWVDPTTIPPRDRVYDHLFRKFVSATVAGGGTGKTSLSNAEIMAMVSGRDLLNIGWSNPRPLRVWYCNLEDPRDDLMRQLAAAAMHYGVQDELEGGLFVDCGREQKIVIAANTPSGGAQIVMPVVDSIIEAIRSNGIDVLIVDPFVSSHRLKENDNDAMDMAIKEWGRISDVCNCAVHLVHHVRKLGPEGEASAESSRGAKAFVDGCRAVRVLNTMTESEAIKAGVENRRRYFRAYIDKGNLLPPADASDWFHLHGVDLGNGKNGYPSDNIAVAVPWEWPSAFDGLSVNDLRRVQAAIGAGEWRESSQAKKWAGYAVADVLDLDADDEQDKARIKTLIKTWIKSGALKVVMGKDERRKDCPFIQVGEPADVMS